MVVGILPGGMPQTQSNASDADCGVLYRSWGASKIQSNQGLGLGRIRIRVRVRVRVRVRG